MKTDYSSVVAILCCAASIKLFCCQVTGPDITRAYLSNVCVAEELHRNGLGYALLEKSKLVAQDWGKKQDNTHRFPRLIYLFYIIPRTGLHGKN